MKVASPIYFSCIILELTPTLSFGNGIYLRVLHVLKSEIYLCSENAELQNGSVPPSWVHLNCGSLSHGQCGDLNDKCHSWAWMVKYLVPNWQCCLGMCRRCGLARKYVLEADFEVSKLPITPSSLSQPPDWSLIGDFSTLFRPPCLSPMHCHNGV